MDLLVMGYRCQPVAEQASLLSGIKQVLVADHECMHINLQKIARHWLQRLGKNYDDILVGATTFGKNLLPRLAALLDVAMVGDVTANYLCRYLCSAYLCWQCDCHCPVARSYQIVKYSNDGFSCC